MKTEDDDDIEPTIEPGGVNKARTKCRCRCCEEIQQFDPSWTYESECPSCDECMFYYVCTSCYGSDEPAFPDQPCAECGKTVDEEEEEHNCEERIKEEKDRVSLGAGFREAKIKEPFPVYQNNILMTYRAIYGQATPGSPPISEADALRMSDDDWKVVRPLVVAELGEAAESTLNIQWCQHQINVFERTWQSDNMAALERGTVEDWTGKPYMLALQSLKVRIRSLREVQLEEGTMPIAPAVKIDEESWFETVKIEKKRTQIGKGTTFGSYDPLANFTT